MTSAPPPVIAGFTFIEPIGAGGCADVYLYQQALPSRRVAVKVLRETNLLGREQFHAEANVMAQLSGHPSIVPIHQADLSSDGRAFLVMEYCPPPHIAQRYRTERIPVPEVLDLGVKIASAVETAHRVGILHRDIKPHNILTSSFGAPLLTDFGIAAVVNESSEAVYGLSIPWSPPEAIVAETPPLDVRSDVYSLGATVYSLLAGRSPFEVPGAANDSATLMHRIETQEPTRILRPDVPDSLNDLLARTLSRSLAGRPPSAMALARGLQEVQAELQLPPTRVEVIDASPDAVRAHAEVSDDRTLVRPVQIIVPDQVAQQGTLLRPRRPDTADDLTRVPGDRATAPDTVQQRRTPGQVPPPPPGRAADTVVPDDGTGRGRMLLGAVLVVVLAAGVAAALLLGRGSEPEADPPPTSPTSALIAGGPSTPEELSATRRGGEVVFTWQNPDPEPDDLFLVRTGASIGELEEVQRDPTARVVVTAPPDAQICIEVATVRQGAVSAPLTECMSVP